MPDRPQEPNRILPPACLTGDLAADVTAIRAALYNPDDLMVRDLVCLGAVSCALLYVESLTDLQAVRQCVLAPLMRTRPPAGPLPDQCLDWIRQHALPVGQADAVADVQSIANRLMSGHSILLVAGEHRALALDTRAQNARPPEETKTEVLIRGPRTGFTEDLEQGMAMVRQRVRDPRLRVRSFTLGTQTRTRLVLMYVEGVASKRIVRQALARVRQIHTNAVLESGYVEQFIEDRPWSPFPQILHTERPDRVAAALLEGRVAMLIEGTPFALVLPATATVFLQSPEDYYERPLVVVVSRAVRVLMVLVAATLPSFYVAFTAYHPEMLPTELAITVAASQVRLPFPTAVEAIIMEVFIELLLEASVRLPTAVGPTVGIVGALIIGESAVRAGIVGPVMIIIIALTAIASYGVPSYIMSFSLKTVRLGMLIITSLYGLIGLMTAINLLAVHLASLESFGVPYLSPLAPYNQRDMQDYLARTNLWRMKRRPDQLDTALSRRQPRRATYLERLGRGWRRS